MLAGEFRTDNFKINLLSLENLVLQLQTKAQMLLIDCRSIQEFETSHIRSSININGSRLTRRKLLSKKVSVTEIISNLLAQTPSKQCLLQADLPLVVYDQCTDDPSSLSSECFAFLIIQLLAPQYTNVKLLKGGFLGFQARYPNLCWENSRKLADEDFVVGCGEEGIDIELPRRVVSSPGCSAGKHHAAADSHSSLASSLDSQPPLQRPRLSPILTPEPVKVPWEPLSGPALPSDNLGPTEILPHLWLGCQADAMTGSLIRLHQITHVLNVSVDLPVTPHVPLSMFMRVPVNDNYTDRLLPHFQSAFDFLNEAKEAGGRVLVHCSAGISRSPTIAIGYLMKHQNMSMKEAYDLVKLHRSTVSPNFNFLGQLVDLERNLASSSPAVNTPVSMPVFTPLPTGSGPKKRDRPKWLLAPHCDPPRQLLPSPSTHLATLNISTPLSTAIFPSSFPDMGASITLDQVIFQPCASAKVRPPAPLPISTSPPETPVTMTTHPAGSGRSLVGLLRRTRSFEDMTDKMQLVFPHTMTGSLSTHLVSSTAPLTNNLISCRQTEGCQSNSSLSSGNSHNSNHTSFSIFPVS